MQNSLLKRNVFNEIIPRRRKVYHMSFEDKLDAMFDHPWSVGKCLGAILFTAFIVIILWIFGCAFIGWN